MSGTPAATGTSWVHRLTLCPRWLSRPGGARSGRSPGDRGWHPAVRGSSGHRLLPSQSGAARPLCSQAEARLTGSWGQAPTPPGRARRARLTGARALASPAPQPGASPTAVSPCSPRGEPPGAPGGEEADGTSQAGVQDRHPGHPALTQGLARAGWLPPDLRGPERLQCGPSREWDWRARPGVAPASLAALCPGGRAPLGRAPWPWGA